MDFGGHMTLTEKAVSNEKDESKETTFVPPKVVAVANTKGGVGKTTVALQIAITRALQGKEVWYVDGDRQQTGQTALALRDANDPKVGIACASYPNGAMLVKQVQRQKDKWDTIVIDVGGFDSTAMRAALLVCDVLIVPFQPRTFDTWSLSQMATLIDEVSVTRGEFPVYAILNSADPGNTSDNRDSEQAIEDFPRMKFLDCPLCRRKAFANASGFGLAVSELKTKDPKAIAEVRNLVEAIFGKEK